MLQYPPAVIYNKAPNGTVTYSGISIEVIDFIGRALNIRYRSLYNTEIAMNSWWNKSIIYSYSYDVNKQSYEYVQVTYADLAKFGPGEAFIRLLVNKVWTILKLTLKIIKYIQTLSK